ncbi:EAL domain-containing protein [Marinobacterium jannaschii]|uniref:EAL domain-containing protein n=1 Tax=Marinobacterium jannaschii TaxID=64970 RepID=UPI0004883A81|nr:EAL domain-containing protein [Marinobacterium jannaschii]
MRLSNISIRRKLILQVLVLIAGISATSGLAFYLTQQDIINERKGRLKHIVEAGISQIRGLHNELQLGDLTATEYQQRLRQFVHHSHFKDNGYLFLYSDQGINIAHPVMAQLEGTNVLQAQDPGIRRAAELMISKTLSNGELYWQLAWPRTPDSPPVPKIGYAEHIPELQLILASSLYLDDLQPLKTRRMIYFACLTALILALSLFVALRISRNISRPLKRLSGLMHALSQGDLKHESVREERRDELGAMSEAVDCFREHMLENNRLREAHEEIRFLQEFDPATRLLNRQSFGLAVQREIHRARYIQSGLTSMVIRFPLLREIAIHQGNAHRDQMLLCLSQRIRSHLQVDDLLARLSDDSFGILLRDQADLISLEQRINQIIETCAAPIELSDGLLQLKPHLGISSYPHNGDHEFQLIGRAEIAAHEATQREQPFVWFDNMREGTRQQIELWQDLQIALDSHQLRLVFQPLYDLASGQMNCAEVLLRWQHPEKGAISPAHFIPVAEQNGIISAVDHWVLDAVARQCREWLSGQISFPRLSINLSAISFLQHDFEERLQQTFAQYNVPLRLIQLELTEGVLINDFAQVSNRIERLHRAGIRIAIDDFGTGYSSLSRLKNLPVDSVKIDRSFVEEIEHNHSDRMIVEAVVLIAKGMGLKSIAEGIETEQQLEWLRQLGCDGVQGFLLSRPLQKADFTALLEQDLMSEVE